MHSFLVSTPPDIKPSPDVLQIFPDPSIGIDEVRQIIGFLSRKPLQSANNTVIIHQAEKLTLPAQHAILKTLEEPPGNSQIYLVTNFPDTLLPTILSRVQLLKATSYKLKAADDYISSKKIIDELIAAKGVGDRLLIIDEPSFTRETFAQFIDDLEHILHQSISEQLPPLKVRGGQEGVIYSLINQSRIYLKANLTLRLILDNFAIRLVE